MTTSPCLLVILAKYGLDGRKDARPLSSNSLNDGTEQDSLEDPRLEKLWHKVPRHFLWTPKRVPSCRDLGAASLLWPVPGARPTSLELSGTEQGSC